MKKLSIFVAALVLTLGLAQCKKEQTNNAQSEGNVVTITLNVGASTGSAANDSRVNVDPAAEEQVTFEDGDQILVASGGHYVGTLTHNGTNFSGNITEPTEGQRLYFYFLGNKQGTIANGDATCTVNISDQTTGLPVISMGKSTMDYSADVTSYTSRLYNKCSLMKFVVETPSTAAICITGMNNTVTVDFSDPTAENYGFTYGQADGGVITMPAKDENNVTWAIVLPQDVLSEGAAGSAYTADNAYTGTRPSMEAIEMNAFIDEGLEMTVNTPAAPAGAISGKFTINAAGDQVYFSKGNLQYIGSAAIPYWKFAENQWDYLGTTTGQNSANQNVDRDLFGWGTSGYNHGANCYQPWSISTTTSDYYAYGSDAYNLYDQTGKADWGYNAISNGGNTENSGWCTLTKNEWVYVFTRTTTSGICYAKATVNGVSGIILLPDNWTASIYALNNANGGNYSSNTITAEDWANTLEANGAVFLPTAGTRSGASVGGAALGYYWSASYYDRYDAYYVYFGSGFLDPQYCYGRNFGRSMRLVRNAE